MTTLLAADGIAALSAFYFLTRKDGTQLGFTDWTADVKAGGVTYKAANGYSRTAMQQRADLAAPNFNVTGILSSDAITDEDVRAGLYNNARIQVWLAVPTDPDFLTYGRIALPGAYLGEIKIEDGVYTAEMRGWAYILQQSYIEVYTPTCRADFCDTRCKLNAPDFTVTGTITGAITPRVSFAMSAATVGAQVNVATDFSFGVCTFTSGKNKGLAVEVSTASYAPPIAPGSTLDFSLYLPSPFLVTPGDTVSVLAGCNKTLAACQFYNNVLNFRGEPFIPGANFLLDYGVIAP